MPIYEYNCSRCGKTVDVLQKVNDPAPAKCEACGAEGSLSKLVSRSSFVLKGGGWYSDLYSSTKKDSKKSDGGGSSGESSGSGSGSGSGSSASSPTASAAAPR